MKRPVIVPVLLILAVAGCQKDSTMAVSQPDTSPTSTPVTTPADTPSTQPTDPSIPESAKPTPDKSTPGPSGELTVPLKSLPPNLPKDLNRSLAKIKEEIDTKFDIPAPNTESWTTYNKSPVTKSAPAIASKIESALASMKNTTGKITVAFESPDGDGTFDQDLKVKDKGQYKVPFIVVGSAPLTCNVVSNGKVKLVQYGPEWRDKVNADAALRTYTPNAAPETRWPRDFTQMVYEPLTGSELSWPAVVKGWLSGKQGYDVSVEGRTLPMTLTNPQTHQTQVYHASDFMLRATRSDSAASSLGKSQIEIVVDAYRWLPTTIKSIYTDRTGTKTWKITWTCHYYFNQKFTPKDFMAPYKAKLKKS